jgi:uncharacterized protein YegL
MRRLPIFLVVDVSESMVGETIYRLEKGISEIVSTLRKDPYALETAYLSVIVFAGRPRTIIPLTELFAFHPPELPVGGGTALGAALDHLMNEVDRTVLPSTPNRKGDWRPIIFLLTDGAPTDDVSRAIDRWNRSYRSRVNLVAVSVGGGADHEVLKRLTEDVIVFDDTAPDAFSRFIRWMSMSIQSQSRSVNANESPRLSLAKAEDGLLVPVEKANGHNSFTGIDDRFAVFLGRCAKTLLPYIVKFERHLGRFETRDLTLAKLLETRSYVLNTVVPVKNSYFDLTENVASTQTVSSDQLIGQPACPHCRAQVGMAVCGCGGIHCLEGEGEKTCPWCGKTGYYATAASGDGFDIGRGQG